MECHRAQGYKIGDVRGGISVRFNISDVEDALTEFLWEDVIVFVFAVIFIPITFFSVIRLFQRKVLRAEQQILKLANTDSLTDLYNRRFLMDRIEQNIEQCRRYDHRLGFIMLDLDHFKQINDQYGHQVGDEVLKKVAEVLRANTRKNDCASRYGGEELALVLPETNFKASIELAEKLRKMISQIEIKAGNDVLKVSASLGVSGINGNSIEDNLASVHQLIKAADDALYRAKQGGRNRVCSADEI